MAKPAKLLSPEFGQQSALERQRRSTVFQHPIRYSMGVSYGCSAVLSGLRVPGGACQDFTGRDSSGQDLTQVYQRRHKSGATRSKLSELLQSRMLAKVLSELGLIQVDDSVWSQLLEEEATDKLNEMPPE